MSEREESEFHADPRMRDGRARKCKACANKKMRALRAARKTGQIQSRTKPQLYSTVPPDWRVSGLAFPIAAGYARSYDGDWWRVLGTELKPVYADDVRMHVMARGASEIKRILENA